MSKEKPAINAIMRGVYTKDKPLDLDKGKYENRLTLLKVPRLTKERILRVSPDMTFVNGEVIFTGSVDKQTIEILKDRTLFNRVNLMVIPTGSDVEFWIKVRQNEKSKSFITIKNFTCTDGVEYVLAYDLPTHAFFNLEYQLANINCSVSINYTFYFETPIKEAIDNIETQQISINGNITNLQAIISDIANIETQQIAINSDLTNLQAIISDIANIETQNISMDGNLTNLQAIISDIANIESQQILIQGDLSNLQAIISDIGNIETQNIAIAGDTSNLQAIISDIANIETQLISIQATNATINTNIGTINTAIANIETTNATIDIDIGVVKDLDLNIVNQRNKGIKSSDNSIASAGTLQGVFNTSDYLYNQLTVRITTSGGAYTYFDLDIRLRESSSTDSELLETHIIEGSKVIVKTFTFNPSHDIYYIFHNNGSSTILVDYIFSFAELEQPYVITLDSKIGASTTIQREYQTSGKLLNRMKVLLYETSTINAQIKLTHLSEVANMNDVVVNETITTGNNYSEQFSFDAGFYFQIEIKNNDAVQDLNFQIILFFSKNLKPELDAHINTSNIHFLESAINLANINEKSYNSLTNKPTIPVQDSIPLTAIRLADGCSMSRWATHPVVAYPAADSDCVCSWSGYMPKGWQSMTNPTLVILVASSPTDTWGITVQADAAGAGESCNTSNLYNAATTITNTDALLWYKKTITLTGTISAEDLVSVEITKTTSDTRVLYIAPIIWIERA